jgi:hypothetical protein
MDDDKTFCGMVAYFWKEKGDPTRYTGWDEVRCAELMNTFYSAWLHYQAAHKALDILADQYDPYGSKS